MVASCAGAIPEVVEDGQTGLLVKPRDPVLLADGIEALAVTNQCVKKMRAKSRCAVHATSLWKRQLQKLCGFTTRSNLMKCSSMRCYTEYFITE